jgi:hypothetical protein
MSHGSAYSNLDNHASILSCYVKALRRKTSGLSFTMICHKLDYQNGKYTLFFHEIWKNFKAALTWRQANSPDAWEPQHHFTQRKNLKIEILSMRDHSKLAWSPKARRKTNKLPSSAYLFVLRFWLNSTKYAYFRESVLTHWNAFRRLRGTGLIWSFCVRNCMTSCSSERWFSCKLSSKMAIWSFSTPGDQNISNYDFAKKIWNKQSTLKNCAEFE